MNQPPLQDNWRRKLDGSIYLIRRTTYLLLVWLTTLGAMFLLHAAYASGGLTTAEAVTAGPLCHPHTVDRGFILGGDAGFLGAVHPP